MEAKPSTPSAPSVENGTTQPPQARASAAGLAELLGLSPEQVPQYLATIKSLYKLFGWDLDAMPPDNSKRPGSEQMFDLVMSAMGYALKYKSTPQSIYRQMDELNLNIMRCHVNRLIKSSPPDWEIQELRGQAELQIDRELADSMHKDLTPTEHMRLLKFMRQRQRSNLGQVASLCKQALQQVQRRKKKHF